MRKLKLKMKTPSYVLISSDYSAQEPRITAFISGDPKMQQAFRDGRDVYATVASFAFGVPYEQCLEFHPETHEYQPEGKQRRNEAKFILLGISYGRSVPSIADQLYGKRTDMTDEEKVSKAQEVYDKVLNSFPHLRNAMIGAENQARTKGYVETILGRRRHLPNMQLPKYEFTAMPGYVNPDIDPLDLSTLDNKDSIPPRIVKQLTKEFESLKYWGQVVKRTKELSEQKIRVINNTKKITEESRKTLNCVDLDTEILTTSGWKYYNEVSEGDSILSFNMETQKIEYDNIEKVHVYHQNTEVIEFKTPTFYAVSTPEHRWVCQAYNKQKPSFITSEHIERNKWPDYPILRVADNDFESSCDFSDNQLKLLGWLLTDGGRSNTTYGLYICQSTRKVKNATVYEEMIEVLDSLGYSYNDTCSDGYYHVITLYRNDDLYEIWNMFPDRRLTYEFINTLSQHQCRLLMWYMISGDGTFGVCKSENGSNITMCLSDKDKCDKFQYLVFRAGYASSFYEVTPEEHNSYPSANKLYESLSNTKPIHITKSYFIVNIFKIIRAQIYPYHKSRKTVPGVWCVSTSNHTWIARRNGFVYVTGNSIIQGSAADQTKMAMIALYHNEDWKRIGGRLLIPVHDELIAEVPEEYKDEGGKILSETMVDAASFLPFPSKCDVEMCIHWYGLSYPCEYDKPSSLDNMSDSNIQWIQYMLYECEYKLPTHKEEFGENFRGDVAKGIDGIYSDEVKSYIHDYMSKYNITDDASFINYIEKHVYQGTGIVI